MRLPVIQVENLSKCYRTGIPRAGAARKWWSRAPLESDLFWSLKGVSFSVEEGEIFGIIGRNGAGKSTLLKILSRITEPTSGKAIVRGKVASLLEVGTGFHPELTGRENVFLNGALLGMSRAETETKFEDIVAFSEIGKFIDMPVKRYSSGMYVRLAFSVAAHLDADVLLVDEVLAVGDYAFQQKCLKKTLDLAGNGRTVLFVSHNVGIVHRLCPRALCLEKGEIVTVGETSNVVHSYLTHSLEERCEIVLSPKAEVPIRLRRVSLIADTDCQSRPDIAYHEGFSFILEYEVVTPVERMAVGINLGAYDGTAVLASSDLDGNPGKVLRREPGIYRTRVSIPGRWLNTGRYLVQAHITHSTTAEVVDAVDALMFNVVDTDSPASFHGTRKRLGVLQPILAWSEELC